MKCLIKHLSRQQAGWNSFYYIPADSEPDVKSPMNIAPLADHKHFMREIAQLHQEEWKHLDRSITLERRINILEKAANNKGIPSVYIAMDGNEFIGSAALVRQDMSTHHPELSPWLAAVFVKPVWRRQGVASKLIKFCEEKAIEERVEKLYLFTEFAQKLYTKLGWQVFQTCKFNGVKVHVMWKELTP